MGKQSMLELAKTIPIEYDEVEYSGHLQNKADDKVNEHEKFLDSIRNFTQKNMDVALRTRKH